MPRIRQAAHAKTALGCTGGLLAVRIAHRKPGFEKCSVSPPPPVLGLPPVFLAGENALPQDPINQSRACAGSVTERTRGGRAGLDSNILTFSPPKTPGWGPGIELLAGFLTELEWGTQTQRP